MFRTRQRAAAGISVLLLGALLTACGSGDKAAGNELGLDSVTIAGEFNQTPTVTFTGPLDPDAAETKVLIEGDGETIADGDTASLQWWVATGHQPVPADAGEDGYAVEPGQATWDEGGAQPIELTKDQFGPMREAAVGHKVGSRVVVLESGEKAFGEAGNPQLGVGNKDAVLFIADIVGKVDVLDGPQGKKLTPATWAPKIIEKDGVVTGLDFSGTPTPGKKAAAVTVIKGDGAKVESGQTIKVNYLGQVHGGDKPFDESYSKEPVSFAIGVGQVVEGWDDLLVGRTVGSRLILQVPPDKGYGKEGRPEAGIKGTDTMFFVVDILGAS